MEDFVMSKRTTRCRSSNALFIKGSALPLATCAPVLVTALAFMGCGGPADVEPDDAACTMPGCHTGASDSGASVADAGNLDPAHAEGSVAENPAPGTSCVAAPGPDEPDDHFADTNCDGIDGDKSRAIFVAPMGSDAAAGSMDKPVKTIGHAMEVAVAAKKSIYVCNGSYAERIALQTSAVSLYGGYDCAAGWRRTTDRAVIAPTQGRALTIQSVTGPVQIDRLSFVAPDAAQNGESSVAVWVADSSALKFTNDRFQAGNAGDGQPGAPVAADTAPPSKAEDGVSVLAPCGRWITTCQAGTGGHASAGACSTGGPGGVGGDARRTPNWQPSGGGAGTPDGAPGGPPGFAGVVGSPGAAGAVGIRAASGFGFLSGNGYEATNAGGAGGQGSIGHPGGGGAGGNTFWNGGNYDSAYVGAGGGQGGHGGCGGQGGKGGSGGGASIALVLYRSSATLSWCALKTASGGAGGAPSYGAAGQPGGQPGAGGSAPGCGALPGCNGYSGGAGARGGPGGAGGPGGGGPSIGIVAVGGAPEQDALTFEIGSGGIGGRGVGSDGPVGMSSATLLIDADAGAAR